MKKGIIEENNDPAHLTEKFSYIFDKKTTCIIVVSVLAVGVVLGGSIAIVIQQPVAKVNGSHEYPTEQDEKLFSVSSIGAPNGIPLKNKISVIFLFISI